MSIVTPTYTFVTFQDLRVSSLLRISWFPRQPTLDTFIIQWQQCCCSTQNIFSSISSQLRGYNSVQCENDLVCRLGFEEVFVKWWPDAEPFIKFFKRTRVINNERRNINENFCSSFKSCLRYVFEDDICWSYFEFIF